MAECPTVASPGALVTQWPQQLELDEFERQVGPLDFDEKPAFAAKVTAGELLPVTDRLPQQPLILLPYQACGRYGQSLRGLTLEINSGTSEILSWRQVNLVRLSDDLQTIVLIESHQERFVAKELFILEIVSGRVDQKSQDLATRPPEPSSRRDSVRNQSSSTLYPTLIHGRVLTGQTPRVFLASLPVTQSRLPRKETISKWLRMSGG